MPDSLTAGLGIIAAFNLVMVFLVDRYCGFFAAYGVSKGIPREIAKSGWFRLLMQASHVAPFLLALTLRALFAK